MRRATAAAGVRDFAGDSPFSYNCTPREMAVLRLLVNGLTDKEIAARLGLARRTVSNYVSTILLKLSARNRTEAVAIAIGGDLARYDAHEPVLPDAVNLAKMTDAVR